MNGKEVDRTIDSLRSRGSGTIEIAEYLLSRRVSDRVVRQKLGMTQTQVEDLMLTLIFKKHAKEGRSRGETIIAVSDAWTRDEICRATGMSHREFNEELGSGLLAALGAMIDDDGDA